MSEVEGKEEVRTRMSPRFLAQAHSEWYSLLQKGKLEAGRAETVQGKEGRKSEVLLCSGEVSDDTGPPNINTGCSRERR